MVLPSTIMAIELHTGDLGYIDTDGFVFIQGCLKRMIMTVIDGAVCKVAPITVKEVIDKHPGGVRILRCSLYGRR